MKWALTTAMLAAAAEAMSIPVHPHVYVFAQDAPMSRAQRWAPPPLALQVAHGLAKYPLNRQSDWLLSAAPQLYFASYENMKQEPSSMFRERRKRLSRLPNLAFFKGESSPYGEAVEAPGSTLELWHDLVSRYY